MGLIGERMRLRPARAWLAALEPAGVPCGPINDLSQVFEDPQVRHRRMEVRAPHPAAGQVRMVASPIKFSQTPVTYDVPPPLLGQHTDEVLAEVLGMSEAEIEALHRGGIV